MAASMLVLIPVLALAVTAVVVLVVLAAHAVGSRELPALARPGRSTPCAAGCSPS